MWFFEKGSEFKLIFSDSVSLQLVRSFKTSPLHLRHACTIPGQLGPNKKLFVI